MSKSFEKYFLRTWGTCTSSCSARKRQISSSPSPLTSLPFARAILVGVLALVCGGERDIQVKKKNIILENVCWWLTGLMISMESCSSVFALFEKNLIGQSVHGWKDSPVNDFRRGWFSDNSVRKNDWRADTGFAYWTDSCLYAGNTHVA